MANQLAFDVNNFPGDFTLVSNFATQANSIMANIDGLKLQLPATKLTEADAVAEEIAEVRAIYDDFLMNFMGELAMESKTDSEFLFKLLKKLHQQHRNRHCHQPNKVKLHKIL
jgi:hypothetical protein